MGAQDSWVLVPPVDAPPGTRAVRHALANELLPITVGLDLLSPCVEGHASEALALVNAAAESLARQVFLLDAFSLCPDLRWVDATFPLQERPGVVAVLVPEQFPEILDALPGEWTAHVSENEVLLYSTADAAYGQLCDVLEPAMPFAVPALGVAVSALARCVHTAGGIVRARRDGILSVTLPARS